MGRSWLPFGQECPRVFSKPNNPGGRIREPLSIRDPVPRKSSLCLSGHPGDFYVSSHRNGHTGHGLSLWEYARAHWLSGVRGWGRQAPVLSNGPISGKQCSWGHTPLTLTQGISARHRHCPLQSASQTIEASDPTPEWLHLPRCAPLSAVEFNQAASLATQSGSLWFSQQLWPHLQSSLYLTPRPQASTSFSIPYGLPKACHKKCI